MKARSSEEADAATSAHELLAVARRWEKAIRAEGASPKKIPSDVREQLLLLMNSATDTFAVATMSFASKVSIGLLTSYRFMAEALVVARWLIESEEADERQSRSLGMNRAALRRLLRTAERAPEGISAGLAPAVAVLRDRLGRIGNDENQVESMPDRAELFRRFLPGGQSLFATVSELASHPGPLAILVTTKSSATKDALFWLSVTYATFVSVLYAIASGLEREDWVEELISTVDRSFPPIGIAWPIELHPPAWNSR